MNEIGGYFELDSLINKPYYEDLVEINTGRNALIYLIKSKNIKKIYIPYFLCNSIPDKLKKHSIEFEYYNINENFIPLFNKKINSNEYIYIVNYYGQITNENINLLKFKYENIIVDNAQSFFQEPLANIDTIYSCRKFFGVSDGAYLSTDAKLNKELSIDISKDRMSHILGRFEGKASEYYREFKRNDEYFKELSLKKMSRLTKNILGAIDYEKVIRKRNENFKYLNDEFKNKNKLSIISSKGPFSYPLYMENGIKIRKELAKKNVYIPTLWPNVLNDNPSYSIEYDYAANILPLPCDQRYGKEDMKRIINYILEG